MIVYIILPKSGNRQEDNEFQFSLEDNGEKEGTGRDEEGLCANQKDGEGINA